MFCKRLCDYKGDCLLCSREKFKDSGVVFASNHYFKNSHQNSFDLSDSICIMLTMDEIGFYNLYLYFPNSKFIGIVKSRENLCIFFQSCNKSSYSFI